jgi:hypothetical protein
MLVIGSVAAAQRRRFTSLHQPQPANLQAALVYDAFTDVEDTRLSAHTPDIAPPGASWAETGTWQIKSNRAVHTGGGGARLAAIDAGQADVQISLNLTTPHNDGVNAGAAANFTDADNQWLVLFAGSLIQLYEHTAGGYTQRAQAAFAYSINTTYSFSIVANGDSIFASVDGVETISYSTADRPHKTATKHGLYAYEWDSGSAQDNFTTEAAP